MRDTIARIADCVADLNSVMNTVSDNETVEFDVDKRLSVLETATDDLTTDVEDAVADAKDLSE